MKPEPSTRNTCRGAAEGGASAAARGSARTASFIGRSSCGAGLARRRVLAGPFGTGAMRRRHHDTRFRFGDCRGAVVDEQPRAIGALDLPNGSEVQIDPRMA